VATVKYQFVVRLRLKIK